MSTPIVNLSNYCSVEDLRNEGFTGESKFPTDRLLFYIGLASRYIDKMTGRWFYPREFKDPIFFLETGNGGSELLLRIPIIRICQLNKTCFMYRSFIE